MSKTETAAPETAAPQADAPKPITLDAPIKRGDTTITQVAVRKPSAGELRGVSLAGLAQMDVDALIVVLPRVTIPALTSAEVKALELSDMLQVGGKLASFLLPKAERI